MAEIDTPLRYQPPDKNKRERRASVCALCVWVIVFAFSWVVLTTEYPVDDLASAIANLVMLSFGIVFLIISTYKIGKAVLSLYKHR